MLNIILLFITDILLRQYVKYIVIIVNRLFTIINFVLGKNKSTILVDILNIIDEQSLTIKDLTDTNFFTAAMENCRYHLQNVDVALRVHSILLKNKNYNLIGDSYKESVY